MATKKKMLQAAAGNAGGAGLNVEDVFSTYLYEGNGSTQTITNGIDLAGEGGWLWIKERNNPTSHQTFNTEVGLSGQGSRLITNDTNTPTNNTRYISSFNSDGFSIGDENDINRSTGEYASWTFRKAPKFFDVVTYTGTGSVQTIAHNLGTTVGSIIIKKTTGSAGWQVYHRSLGATKYMILDENSASYTSAAKFNDTEPTDTVFTVSTNADVNQSGQTYVAYLFAHNDGDGEFGPDGDADIIKCGSYTGNGSNDGPEIDLGFEPQWVMIKDASSSGNWTIYDAMRGWPVGGEPQALYANSSSAEQSSSWGKVDITSTGFKIQTSDGDFNQVGTYIYIAIRRGTKVPESATEVFDIADMSSFQSTHIVNMTPDAALLPWRTTSYDDGTNSYPEMFDRLRGKGGLQTSNNRAENTGRNGQWDYMDRFTGVSSTGAWMWKRAPGFFDVVAYTGQLNLANPATFTVPHNLGVIPELVIVKSRTTANKWSVGSTLYPNGGNMVLNEPGGIEGTNSTYRFNYAGWTDSLVSFGSDADVGRSGQDYIAYLFASLPGISKVGSFTTTSGDLSVDCGFTSGARFILMKKTNIAEDWAIFDSERGIVAGNDPILTANTTAAEITNADAIDPLSSGFIVRGSFWGSGMDYIFYAIA